MSRTNKGGTRLRVITGFTAAAAVAAGVLAAHGFKAPLTVVCTFPGDAGSTGDRLGIIGDGRNITMKCTGVNVLATYDITPVGSNWNSTTPFTASGSSLQSGISIQTKGAPSSSQSGQTVSVSLSGVPQDDTPGLEIYKAPSYSNTTTSVLAGSSLRLSASNMISGSSYKMQSYYSGSLNNSDYGSATGTGLGNDTSNLATFPSSGYLSAYLSSTTIDTYVATFDQSPVSYPRSVDVQLSDNNGNVIDHFPTVTFHL